MSEEHSIKIHVKDLNLFYGESQSLYHINMAIPQKRVTAFIGPSGCGKSTLLRCFNRMNDLIDGVRTTGEIVMDDKNILNPKLDVIELRKKVGMVFQKPNPFPRSIYENVAYGLRIHHLVKSRSEMDDRVEHALKRAALWDEVKNRLSNNVNDLSGGQQQRLVIARAVAISPQVILLDEPASALDPISTLKIEDLINEISQEYTVVIVTHNMQQAGRVSHYTAFMYMGELIEFAKTKDLFTNPIHQKTQDYITGRYG